MFDNKIDILWHIFYPLDTPFWCSENDEEEKCLRKAAQWVKNRKYIFDFYSQITLASIKNIY